MRTEFAVVISLAFLGTALAHPATSVKPEDEVEIITMEDPFGLGGPAVVDTGVFGGPFSSGPFDGLFGSISSMMTRMRQQMDEFLKHLPGVSGGNVTHGPGLFPQFGGVPDFDLSKGNTTSVTKVIDGHKVVINETEYKQDGEFGGTFFKVRIIDVKPDGTESPTSEENDSSSQSVPSSSSPAGEEVSSSKDVEAVESSIENEIPKNKEAEVFTNIETFDDIDSVPYYNYNEKIVRQSQNRWDAIEPLETLDVNSVDYDKIDRPQVVDLSRDIYVNRMLADAGAPTNPDAEVFSDVELVDSSVPQRRPFPFERMMNPR